MQVLRPIVHRLLEVPLAGLEAVDTRLVDGQQGQRGDPRDHHIEPERLLEARLHFESQFRPGQWRFLPGGEHLYSEPVPTRGEIGEAGGAWSCRFDESPLGIARLDAVAEAYSGRMRQNR